MCLSHRKEVENHRNIPSRGEGQRCNEKGDSHKVKCMVVRAGGGGWHRKLRMRFGNGAK